MHYLCIPCGYLYDEDKTKIDWDSKGSDWCCPDCGNPSDHFRKVDFFKSDFDEPSEFHVNE